MWKCLDGTVSEALKFCDNSSGKQQVQLCSKHNEVRCAECVFTSKLDQRVSLKSHLLWCERVPKNYTIVPFQNKKQNVDCDNSRKLEKTNKTLYEDQITVSQSRKQSLGWVLSTDWHPLSADIKIGQVTMEKINLFDQTLESMSEILIKRTTWEAPLSFTHIIIETCFFFASGSIHRKSFHMVQKKIWTTSRVRFQNVVWGIVYHDAGKNWISKNSLRPFGPQGLQASTSAVWIWKKKNISHL